MDHAAHLLPGGACTRANTAVAFPRPRHERPLRALIVVVTASLAVIDLLPFYVDVPGRLWERLVDDVLTEGTVEFWLVAGLRGLGEPSDDAAAVVDVAAGEPDDALF